MTKCHESYTDFNPLYKIALNELKKKKALGERTDLGENGTGTVLISSVLQGKIQCI